MTLRRLGARSTLLLVAAFLAPAGAAAVTEPHAFMEEESECGGCHAAELDGEGRMSDPHIFDVPVVDLCTTCHSTAQLGRSHPVNTAPRTSRGLAEVPEALPLHRSGDTRVVTCGTCHNPHLPRLSTERLFPRQEAHPGQPGRYRTYYLRATGGGPAEGFAVLCRACHPDL